MALKETALTGMQAGGKRKRDFPVSEPGLYVPVQTKPQSCGVGGFINGDASPMAGCMLKTGHLFLIAEKVCSHRQIEDEIQA